MNEFGCGQAMAVPKPYRRTCRQLAGARTYPLSSKIEFMYPVREAPPILVGRFDKIEELQQIFLQNLKGADVMSGITGEAWITDVLTVSPMGVNAGSEDGSQPALNLHVPRPVSRSSMLKSVHAHATTIRIAPRRSRGVPQPLAGSDDSQSSSREVCPLPPRYVEIHVVVFLVPDPGLLFVEGKALHHLPSGTGGGQPRLQVNMITLLLGVDLTGTTIPVARVAGIALIGLGIACWPGPPLVGMLIYGAAVAL